MKPPKRDQRLLSSRQFRIVYDRGRKFSTPFFSAFFLLTNDGRQRMGLTTTRKIGGAVLRNRCRRRLREVFRLRNQASLDGVSFDLVLNVKPTAASADYQEIEASFSQTLLRFRHSIEKAKPSEKLG
ncbi:MAG: ribonuclease P protein component [Blastocatellia bacterium]|nr:ribonuclease P protein component [Blastocatellia bacterium]